MKDLLPWNRSKSLSVQREIDPIQAMRNEMSRVFDNYFTNPFGMAPFAVPSEHEGMFFPQVDISEADKEITITAELPGIDEKDIQVSFAQNVVSISGKKEIEKTDKGRDYYHVERSYGSFHREIPLRVKVDVDKIEASFDKGVLTITAPRQTSADASVKHIQVNKS